MRRQLVLTRELHRFGHITRQQHLAADRVLQRQQPRARKVIVDGFDGGDDLVERQRAVCGIFDRLRLDAAEHRCAAAFVFVGVGRLTDDVFIATSAMRHQRGQVALCAARKEQARFLAGALGHSGLQTQHGRVVAPYVVSNFGGHHGRQHRLTRTGDGIAAQIDHVEFLCEGAMARANFGSRPAWATT